jgi:hypothetical protein
MICQPEPSAAKITRDQARTISEEYLAQHGPIDDATGVGEVVCLRELKCRAPSIYGLSPEKLNNAWIVYLNRPLIALRSSAIIVVCWSTGKVLYFGSAHDEG